jgi:hypothetical protein
VVMLPCAGAYLSGAEGSNACPAGSARIETEAACRTAAAAAGKTPADFFGETSPFVVTRSDRPRGCHYAADSTAWFNTHAVGAGNSRYRLLCPAVTTGAPPPNRSGTLRVLTGYSNET